ncbi:conserved hypothetical protein; putative exported protein [Cupriavidus taiwanensis]|uniref:Uncharacterized protein n=1 Tax=Cupriavidus taiwanensis TaxID=164546 RepID=A0A976AX94_9BURK|nr:hypothetical protein [Cupriavidus taiwanensis]SOZ14383.1 conserved hypothetical protein; putative exported protein [Cupriavidus taiwanensis]SOZ25752.1 conserved hypothetical protein; putative exported protein [Cupriavidus taiwanensis]SOZ44993.1 conserved hypothetical protein; putative exported protein [Cupriavidus taiwanensis]SOZ57502.1 conserved hypothetical protein; putative exported protein [Cupriavidus taiwanensis]SOZ58176.1 conserved hypothetical protein; putative exported protein [Cup
MKFPVAGLALAGLLGAAGANAATPAGTAATPASAPAARPSAQAENSALAPLLAMLEIGNPLPALPDCADKRTPDGRDVTGFCVELKGDGLMRQVGVPRAQRPAFMDGPYVVAFVDRNALVGLMVPTAGANSQQAAADSISALYGKPFRQEQEDMRDKAGKTVKTLHAGWMHKPLTVELYAMPEDPNTGTIEMLLPQARALMADKDAEVDKQLNPPPAPAAKGGKAAAAKPAPKAPAKPEKPGSW